MISTIASLPSAGLLLVLEFGKRPLASAVQFGKFVRQQGVHPARGARALFPQQPLADALREETRREISVHSAPIPTSRQNEAGARRLFCFTQVNSRRPISIIPGVHFTVLWCFATKVMGGSVQIQPHPRLHPEAWLHFAPFQVRVEPLLDYRIPHEAVLERQLRLQTTIDSIAHARNALIWHGFCLEELPPVVRSPITANANPGIYWNLIAALRAVQTNATCCMQHRPTLLRAACCIVWTPCCAMLHEVWFGSNFMQHHPTSCNRVFKRCNMLHATMLDDVACNMLRSFERAFTPETCFFFRSTQRPYCSFWSFRNVFALFRVTFKRFSGQWRMSHMAGLAYSGFENPGPGDSSSGAGLVPVRLTSVWYLWLHSSRVTPPAQPLMSSWQITHGSSSSTRPGARLPSSWGALGSSVEKGLITDAGTVGLSGTDPGAGPKPELMPKVGRGGDACTGAEGVGGACEKCKVRVTDGRLMTRTKDPTADELTSMLRRTSYCHGSSKYCRTLHLCILPSAKRSPLIEAIRPLNWVCLKM